jgi:hypothetical protein
MLRMIRPFTCICFVLACGSGLYLYQAKHRVQLIDRAIANAVHATEELREQSRVLRAEWTLENDPQRLQTLADQFLVLKSVAPSQFTGLVNLDGQLPAVPVAEPPPSQPPPDGLPPGPPAEAQVSEPQQPAVSPQPPAPDPAQPAASAPPEPASAVAPSAQRPSEHKSVPAVPHTANADPPPIRPPKALTRSVVAIVQPHPVMPPHPGPPPSSGSALGMARAGTAPPPKPQPFIIPPGGPGGG